MVSWSMMATLAWPVQRAQLASMFLLLACAQSRNLSIMFRNRAAQSPAEHCCSTANHPFTRPHTSTNRHAAWMLGDPVMYSQSQPVPCGEYSGQGSILFFFLGGFLGGDIFDTFGNYEIWGFHKLRKLLASIAIFAGPLGTRILCPRVHSSENSRG